MDGNRNEALASLGALLQAPDPPDESALLKIALSKPEHYLEELREVEMRTPALFIKHQATIRLLQGELLLALQKDSAALLCFREVHQRLPYYLMQRSGAPFIVLPRGTPRLVPNSADNWLLQRFLALNDHESALSEFNRVWEILTQKLRPYALCSSSQEGHTSITLVEPCGPDTYALHFTKCFALFLNAQKQRIRMVDMLMRTTLAVDLDRNPGRPPSRQLASGESVPPSVPLISVFEAPTTSRLTRRDFLRFVIGEFERVNQLPVLMRDLFKQSRTRNHVHLTIAFCMSTLNACTYLFRIEFVTLRYRQAPQDVMDMELDYLHGFKTDQVTRAYRAGLIFEAHNMRPAAVAHFELALKSPWNGWPQLPDTDDAEHFGLDLSSKTRADFVKFVVSKLICLYQEFKGDEHVSRLLELLEWQFEECPELLEHFPMLELTQHYFAQYKQSDRFSKWIRRLPVLGASWRAQGNVALLLGDYELLSRLLSTAAADGKIDFSDYLRWRNLVLHQHVTHTTTEDGVSFGVVGSSVKSLACAQALLASMLKRYPTDERLQAEQQDQQDFTLIP